MTAALRLPLPPAGVETEAFRAAMRNLAGGVTLITAGEGARRAGLTATSVSSLSLDPPSLIVCLNRCSSTLPVLLERRAFGVSLLAAAHRELAERFAGRTGIGGAARYAGYAWTTLETGAPLLADALAAFDCAVAASFEWHSHVVLIGTVAAIRFGPGERQPLLYWRGNYAKLAGGSAVPYPEVLGQVLQNPVGG